MNICVIGTGYVGLVTGVCFAEMGHNVVCVDIDQYKIEKLNEGIIPIYEPGLQEMLNRNIKEKRISFTTNSNEAINRSLFIFVAVGTPTNEDGYSNLSYIFDVAKKIGENINGYKVIVAKSTVPVGTCEKIRDIIKEELLIRNVDDIEFDIASNPEFLKEGSAVDDFMKPDRIIIGVDNVRTGELIKELYSQFLRNGHPIITMDIQSSEMTKYAANAILATRISFMNEISKICEVVGADIENVRKGIGSDSRIGKAFLYAGIGYGGSCFPKDIKALIGTAKSNDIKTFILNSVECVNDLQKGLIVDKIVNRFGEDLSKYEFAIWGVAFKPQTDDMRDAPSLTVVKKLLERGAKIKIHDPVALENAKNIFEDQVEYVEDNYKALNNVDALLLLTEWHCYRNPDFSKIKEKMKQPIIFDGRNQYEPKKITEMGFEYFCIGRGCYNEK